MSRYLAALGLLLLSGLPARADEPMILVESVSPPIPNVSPMTYINAGTTIDLGQSTVLVLDHLNTCVRETITGGVVHVADPVSQIANGTFKNARLACDGGNLASAAVASQGGVVYRALGDPLLIRSTTPLFVAATTGTLVITKEGDEASPKFSCRSPTMAAAAPSRWISPKSTRRSTPVPPTAQPWAIATSSFASPQAPAATTCRPCSASCRSKCRSHGASARS